MGEGWLGKMSAHMKNYSITIIVSKSVGFSFRFSLAFLTTFLHKEGKIFFFFMGGEERSFLDELEWPSSTSCETRSHDEIEQPYFGLVLSMMDEESSEDKSHWKVFWKVKNERQGEKMMILYLIKCF